MRKLIALAALVAAAQTVGCSGDDGAGAGGAGASGSEAASMHASSGHGGMTGSTGSGASSGGGGGHGPVTPTASKWLGTNVAGDLPRVDVTYQTKPFDTDAAQKDADGYPKAGVNGTSSTDLGFVLPTGTYTLAWKGDGALAVSGIGAAMGAPTMAGGEHRQDVAITATPGVFGRSLTLTITNGAGQTVTGVRLLMPGHDANDDAIFLPEFLRLLKPFRALRFMEWEGINGSTLTDWADRPTASHFGASGNGEPYEHMLALVNQTGKDAWINVPEHASDAFVEAFAKFVADGLDLDAIATARAAQGIDAPFRVIVEVSNETWNGGFSAHDTLLAEANADPTRFTGTYDGAYGPSWMSDNKDLMKVGQVEGDRLVKIGDAFRSAFGSHKDVVAPVLAGWALGAVYSDVALRFIKANYGDPKKYVSYVAIAPYFGADDAQTGDLGALFTASTANIDAMAPTFQDFKMLVAEYGVEMAAYEGGQGFNGTTNQNVKHLAQHDARMKDTYDHYFDLWKQTFGDATFMHFDLAGTPGIPDFVFQYGYWGSIISTLEAPAACSVGLQPLSGSEAIADVVHRCPKYASLMAKVPE